MDVIHCFLLDVLIAIAAQRNPKSCQKVPLILNVLKISFKNYFQFVEGILDHLDHFVQRILSQ